MESDEILALALAIEEAAEIDVHSGDREPPSHLTDKGRIWVVNGLRLLAMAVETPNG